MDVESLIYYNFVFILTVLFAFLYEVYRKKGFLVISFLSITLFCGLRFNVGNDYGGYVGIFEAISNNYIQKSVEIGYYYLNDLFSSSKEGYLYVFFICSSITLYFIYKVLLFYRILSLGLFFVFASEFLLMINDQIRQGIAIALFFYCIRFIERKQFFKYFVCILIIAFLFHYTALILVLVYFIKNLHFKKKMWYLLLVTTFVMYRLGLFNGILDVVLANIPFYNKYLLKDARYLEVTELGSGLAVTFWLILSLVVVYYLDYLKEHKIIVTIFLIGMILYFVTLDFPLLGRVTNYFIYTKILVFPMVIRLLKRRNLLVHYSFLILSFLFFQFEIALNLGKHGGFPYQTIFNKEKSIINRK